MTTKKKVIPNDTKQGASLQAHKPSALIENTPLMSTSSKDGSSAKSLLKDSKMDFQSKAINEFDEKHLLLEEDKGGEIDSAEASNKK